MATATQNFGTETSLTVTNLHSLADGSYWQSASIDNSSIKGFWIEIFITILTTTTAAADSAGTIDVLYAGSTDGGTTFAGGASGTEGTYATTGNNDPALLDPIDSMPCDASETTARTYTFRTKFYDIGEHFAIVIAQNSGATNGATVNAVDYRIHKHDSA